MCKLISKLTITRQFKEVPLLSRLLIITVKQPSASQNPVIQFGSNLLGILVLVLILILLKTRVRGIENLFLIELNSKLIINKRL
jgi:hypothetical protein